LLALKQSFDGRTIAINGKNRYFLRKIKLNKALDNEKMLRDLASNKDRIAISAIDAKWIDQTILKRWQIDFFETVDGIEEFLSSIDDAQVRSLGLSSLASAKRSVKGGGDESAVYEAMCEPILSGIFASTRRHFLIDSIALTVAIVRKLGITGPILDVGCHVGIFPDLLHGLIENHITGLEPVQLAIKTATQRIEKSEKIEFIYGKIPWAVEQRFDLITAIDSMPSSFSERAVFLHGLSDLLEDGGIAIIVSQHWVDADVTALRRQLTSCNFGFGLADVVGGYGGMPTEFDIEGCVVLVKMGKQAFPRKVYEEMENYWNVFQNYANDTRTPKREKTQTFHRAV
jgi:SAM-dependent methyltransferase